MNIKDEILKNDQNVRDFFRGTREKRIRNKGPRLIKNLNRIPSGTPKERIYKKADLANRDKFFSRDEIK